MKSARKLSARKLLEAEEELAKKRTSLSDAAVSSARAALRLLMELVAARMRLMGSGTAALRNALEQVAARAARATDHSLRRALLSSAVWNETLLGLRALRASRSEALNPKLIQLQALLMDFFTRKARSGGVGTSRAIVFCQTRTTVQEVMSFLDELAQTAPASSASASSAPAPLRPVAFVGQSRMSLFDLKDDGESDEESEALNSDLLMEVLTQQEAEEDGTLTAVAGKTTASVLRKESVAVTGQTQKEQQETIAKFKQGIFNIMVATCIGEEGLDIGEVCTAK